MHRNRGIFVTSLCAGLAVALTAGAAQASCAALAGTWYFYDMQGQSPNGDLADRIRALQSHASRVPHSDKPTSRN